MEGSGAKLTANVLKQESLAEARSESAQAVEEVLGDAIDKILEIHRTVVVNDPTQLVSSRINKVPGISDRVKDEIASLHRVLAVIIRKTAEHIEMTGGRDAKRSLESVAFSLSQQQRAERLLSIDEKLRITTRTLSLLVPVLAEVNKKFLERFNQTRETMTTAEQQSAALKNATLVYEVADFVINQLDTFRIDKPLSELSGLRDEIKKTSDKARKDAEGQLKKFEGMATRSEGQQHLADVAAGQLNALKRMEDEWAKYSENWLKISGEGQKSIRDGLEMWKDLRSAAENQIRIIDVITVSNLAFAVVKLLDTGAAIAAGLKIMVLSEDTVNIMLGMDTGQAAASRTTTSGRS